MANPEGRSKKQLPGESKELQRPDHPDFRQVYNHNPMTIMAIDSGGLVNYANTAALNFTGLAMDEILGVPLSNLLKDAADDGKNEAKLLASEKIADQEFIVNSPHGKERWALVSSNVVTDASGELQTYLFIRDISSFKKKERLYYYLNKAAEELAKARDTQSALDQISQFIVPKFADWFTIDLLKGDHLELILLKHQDPKKMEWARQYRKDYPPHVNGNSGSALVLKTGKPGFVSVVTEKMIAATVPDPVQLKAVKQIGLQSVIIAPMFNSGSPVGVVNFISSDAGRRFDEFDLEFALNFANLIFLALQNARLNEAATQEISSRKQSEDQFRFLTDAIPHKLWTSGPDGRATYYNQVWHDYTGINGFAALKEKIWDTIHPDDRLIAAKQYPIAIQDGVDMEMEQRFLRYDGIYRWHLTRFTAHKNEQGQTLLWVGTSTDIHEQKEASLNIEAANTALSSKNNEIAAVNEELSAANEELAAVNEEMAITNEELIETQDNLRITITNLAASESRFRFLVKGAPVAIGVLNSRELIIESANEKILEIWGKSSDIIGQRLDVAIPELQGQPYLQLLDDVYTSGQPFYGYESKVLLEHNGELGEFYFDFIYQPLDNENGNTKTIIVIAVEVTGQVEAKKELERVYEQARLSKEAAQLGTFDMDMIKGTMEWDERCRILFGISHSDQVTYEKDFVTGLHPDDRDRVLDIINDVFIKSVNNGDYDVEYRTVGVEDQKIRWVRAKGQAYFDNDDKPIRFIGSVLDITEQKADEQRKNDFIGMASHELKTPLTSLTALVQVLAVKLKNNEDPFVSGALEKANKQVKKMSNMINGFLNISRLESGKILILKEDFRLDELLHDMVNETELAVTSHFFHFGQCDQITVNADHDKIGSVISNLLSNAVKYSPKGKNIEVRCEKIGETARIGINDEGMGIKPQDREKLFERYYRVENNHTQQISGFGIGLYLSAEIIHRHGGKIWVDSESGIGSTFYFTLPLA